MKIEQVHYSDRFQEAFWHEEIDDISRYLRLAAEYGRTQEGESYCRELEDALKQVKQKFEQLALSARDPQEPDDLPEILVQRPDGPRQLLTGLPEDYAQRLRGAFYGRMAGCTLGAALEFEPIPAAKSWAERFGDLYPLTDYWSEVRWPEDPHYIVGKKKDLTRAGMDAIPPDDDTMYTLLGLLTMEAYGPDFTQEQMAEIWKKYLPLGRDYVAGGEKGCWWGERSLLKNLLAGVPLPQAGVAGNPNLQGIAAWTRADSYGYVFPGNPEKAAALAYRDASINHRRNGVYGSMFMAAAISAAFAVDDPMEAVRIGLTEIPKDSLFAEGIRWALAQSPSDYPEAFDQTWARYRGMFNGSALTNAIHVVMGLKIGGGDFTKTIGETVAMSGDNDCTGATAGSILGAVIGIGNIPEHWIRPFHGRMHGYAYNTGEEYDMVRELGVEWIRLNVSFPWTDKMFGTLSEQYLRDREEIRRTHARGFQVMPATPPLGGFTYDEALGKTCLA